MDNTVGKYRAGTNLAAFWLLVFVNAEYFTYSINIAIKAISLLFALAHSIACGIYIGRINRDRRAAGIRKKWWLRILIGVLLAITSVYAVCFLPLTVLPPWFRGLVLAFNHILLFRLPFASLRKEPSHETENTFYDS